VIAKGGLDEIQGGFRCSLLEAPISLTFPCHQRPALGLISLTIPYNERLGLGRDLTW